MITIDDLVSEEECNNIVSHITSEKYDSVIPRKSNESKVAFKHQHRIKFTDSYLQTRMTDLLKEAGVQMQVCRSFSYVDYEEGGYLPLHTDSYDETDATHVLILYLNDDYENGDTYIMPSIMPSITSGESAKMIEKKTGKAVIFKGQKVPHGVYPVTRGHKRVLLCKLHKSISL
jgi:hypothetical protein